MSENIKYPTLHVKNFAKIKEAKIELSPFTLFIGDNNSGKTYLASLYYGLIRYNNDIINIIFKDKKIVEEYEEYKKIENIIKKYIRDLSLNHFINLEADILQYFIDFFNFLLNKNLNHILNLIFNSNNQIYLEEIKLELDVDKYNFEVEKSTSIGISGYNIFLFLNYHNKGFGENISDIFGIIKVFIYTIVHFSFYAINPIFLPSSRTGFLLSKNDIFTSAIFSKYDRYFEEKNKQYLSKPLIDFLISLNELSKNNMKIYNEKIHLIDFIEKNMLFGKIMINEETKNIYYKPDNTELEFQMYLSSAVVTELTPLYLFLKYGFIINKLFIEEPEISLHPQLQQQLTRLFIKLVNTGTDITITTHSDTIIQHINNMIKLNNNKEDIKKELMKKYNYNEDDLISEDKVRMYQFDIKEDGFTDVTEIKCSKYGFQTTTFHNYLIQSSEEFEAFIEDLDN
ncbi:AAA family ATPase [Brachyspira intermedia]|uniref:AAA family ATPase n=1 Tax=Brachyspira intermedia TaxID=84377 RepID=UPI0030059927